MWSVFVCVCVFNLSHTGSINQVPSLELQERVLNFVINIFSSFFHNNTKRRCFFLLLYWIASEGVAILHDSSKKIEIVEDYS